MKNDVLQNAEKYINVHQKKKRWHRLVSSMACVVVFCTVYALILPAITLEKKTCEKEEHIHGTECYTQVTSVEKKKLICNADTLKLHHHTSDCYDSNGTLICGYADFVVHHHDSSCFSENGNLRCPLEEIELHEHTAGCYAVSETETTAVPHTHTEDCYTLERGRLICGQEESNGHQHADDCYDENGELICGNEESSGHRHTDDCYEWNKVLTCELSTEPVEDTEQEAEPELICGKQEVILHEHTQDCFDADGNLICGKIQVLEHQHTDDCFAMVEEPVDTETLTCTNADENHVHGPLCYGTWELTCGKEEHTHSTECMPAPDADADVENTEDWEQTFAEVSLTGNLSRDVTAIAETQLGYTESTKNYSVSEDGETIKGYTRYGAWYGEPYGDWDAMFVSFCLYYAGAEETLLSGDCGSWVEKLSDHFVPAEAHEPSPGELVFFDRDGDGMADHAGILTEINSEKKDVSYSFSTIEGDVPDGISDSVQAVSHSTDEAGILGYAVLTEQVPEFTLTEQSENGITVTVTGACDALPYPADEVTVTVREVVDGEGLAVRDQLMKDENADVKEHFLLDIVLWHNDEEIEPTGSVTVTFSGLHTEGCYPKVYHIDTEKQKATDMEAVTEDSGDITVDTDHFSYYDVQLLSAPEGTGISGEGITQIANGGTYYLTATAYTSNTITITKNTVLDLNGCGVYYKGTTDFLVVNSGAELTIKDSSPGSVTESGGSGNLYGNAASLEFEGNGNKPVKLTWYVTESSAGGTGTSETLKKYELNPTGCIVAEAANGASSVVKVNSGGTCNLEEGLLTIRNSGSYSGDAHIIQNSGTLNIKGGYIAGGKDSCWGGGIYSGSGSSINMTGGVIADNYGTNGGGICIDSGSFTMSGGVISGNGTHSNSAASGKYDGGLGGGVYAKNATVSISGGYLTNNSAYGRCASKGSGCHGGGGMAATGGSLSVSGGYITGNYSAEAGGGLYVGHYSIVGTGFTMTGGTVAANYAGDSEGGGIRISGGTTGVINASDSSRIYITNNQTNSSFDWGGGGIFVQEKGTLNILNSLITNNRAGGFGGGVGACPTGETLIVHNEGAAIYSNTASGNHMSGGGNGKNYDSTVANASNVFKSNGYQDYFCVRAKSSSSYISLVTGEMVGGGAANWQGSCDEQEITISKTGHAAAKYLFGLTAHPDNSAISGAQSAAGVIITGNSAYTHGGGIMTNGGLILGKTDDRIVTATPALDISGMKAFTVDGISQNSGLDFQFQLTDTGGKVVGTATADASTGRFTISPDAKYTQAGTYTYYLSEINDNRSGVVYDTSRYEIKVKIGVNSITLLGVTFTSYYVDSVKVTKTDGDTTGDEGTASNLFRIHYKNENSWSNVYLHIWNGTGLNENTAWPGMPVEEDPNNEGWYTKEFTVSGSGTFNFIFSNGSNSNKTGDLSGNYAPGTELWVDTNGSQIPEPSGWNSGGGVSSNVDVTGVKNSDESYTLTINGSAFTNTKQSALNLKIVKADSNDSERYLEGAVFLLKKVGKEGEEADTGVKVTTDRDGIALFENIQRNTTYYLYEIKAPENYMAAGPWILEIAENGTGTLYPAEEGADGTLNKTDENGTGLTASGSDPIILSVSISNQSMGYELPETGGPGTAMYIMGGLLLTISAGLLLLYNEIRRRKEDGGSS